MIGRSSAEVNRDIQVRTAQHIFEVLGELRGCATKLGQILSLYELALPPELAAPYHSALSQLQESGPAMLPRGVHAAMAASMGRDWRANFREFDCSRPMAASVGQVHKAVWHDGRTVAVKVQYPGAREAIHSDLKQLRRIATLMGVFLPGADIRPVTDEICTRIVEELDYAAEANNQAIFAAAYATHPDVLVPKIIAQKGDVLVSEWVGGTSLTKVINWVGPQAERDRIGVQILRFCLDGPRRCGLMYGDPHPGNFRVLPDGRLGVLDFGACSELPIDFLDLALDVTDTLLNGNLVDLAAMIRRRGFVQPGRDFDVLTLERSLRPYREAMLEQPDFHVTTKWLRRRVLESADLRLTNVYRQLTVSADLTAFGRTALSAAAVLAQLNARIPLAQMLGNFLPGFADAHARAVAANNVISLPAR